MGRLARLSRRHLTGLALIAASLALSGCLPLHTVGEGTEVTTQDLQWLRAGERDRRQVLARFGAPDVDFEDQRTIAYAWSGTGGLVYLAGPVLTRHALMGTW